MLRRRERIAPLSRDTKRMSAMKVSTLTSSSGGLVSYVQRQRQIHVAATAVGASTGALEANYFRANLVAYAVAILLVGMLSFSFHLKKNAYRRKILLVLSP